MFRDTSRGLRSLAGRGYDHDKYRGELWNRGAKPVIARRRQPTVPGWAGNAGSWSEPSPGCTT
jgi:hypothetical protein